jgi:hypothetical protein
MAFSPSRSAISPIHQAVRHDVGGFTMRSIWNSLSDPSLHFLAVALFLVYLAFGNGSWSRNSSAAEAPLSYCQKCHAHYLPEKSCECRLTQGIVNALR